MRLCFFLFLSLWTLHMCGFNLNISELSLNIEQINLVLGHFGNLEYASIRAPI